MSVPYEELIKKVKVTQQLIFSEIWKEKIRPLKDEIKCLDPHKRDPILITQQAQDWWQDFNATMRLIYATCEQIS